VVGRLLAAGSNKEAMDQVRGEGGRATRIGEGSAAEHICP